MYDVKWFNGLPTCRRAGKPTRDACEGCYGLGRDGDYAPLCMAQVRDDHAALVAIACVVHGPDYDRPHDDPDTLAGLPRAVQAIQDEKERLRREVDVQERPA